MLRLSRHERHNLVASREPKRAVRQGAKMKLRNRLRVLRSRRRRKRSLASPGSKNGRTGAGRGLSSLLLARAMSMQRHYLRTSAGAGTVELPSPRYKNFARLRAQHCPDRII